MFAFNDLMGGLKQPNGLLNYGGPMPFGGGFGGGPKRPQKPQPFGSPQQPPMYPMQQQMGFGNPMQGFGQNMLLAQLMRGGRPQQY